MKVFGKPISKLFFTVTLMLSVALAGLFIYGQDAEKEVNTLPIPQFSSANPEPVDMFQPDGTVVTLRLIGDEWTHYAQTMDGFTVLKAKNDFYHYAELDADGNLSISPIKVRNLGERTVREQRFLTKIEKHLRFSDSQLEEINMKRFGKKDLAGVNFGGVNGTFPTTGTRNFLMILVSFSDKAFVKSNSDLNSLMNTATKNFKKYHQDNSYNSFTVNTTVVGPYTLSGSMSYYGANDSSGYDLRPRQMVQEAVDLANAAGLDFSQFDNDGNGYVDGIQVVHAGYGEEAGAPSYTIWSHRWTLYTYARTYDGVTINDYSTVPELQGASGTTLVGLGVICHEFGHNLGAPDYYDTDYSGSGGTAWHLQTWDVMASGSWNDSGQTPPHHNAYTKWKFGWLTPTTLTTTQNLTIPTSTTSATAYKFDTTTSNEFFIIENRQRTGLWDVSLSGHGLLVFHVDENYINSSSNRVNANPAHQGMDLEEADNVRSSSTYGGDPFPGTANKTSFTDTTTPNAKSWAGANTNKPLTGISEGSGNIYLTFTAGSSPVTYCTASGNNYSYEWISGVTVGSMTKTSGAAGYSDYTSTTCNLTPGASTSVSLTPGYSSSTYNEYWAIYIDYNKDGDFTDSGETVFTSYGSNTRTGSFTVSASATGTTRMRVVMNYYSSISSCGTFTYGEVEDYTVSF